MKALRSSIAVLCLMALMTAGCVSTGEHERVLREAKESSEALTACQNSLAGAMDRIERLTDANSLLIEQAEVIKARRESLGELVAECEFAVRERDDEYKEQAAALRELERELDARQKLLKSLLERKKAQEELVRSVEALSSDLRVVFSAQIEDGQASVSATETRALLMINNKLLYKSYGAKLTGMGKVLLGKAADSFKRIGINSLALEAYTDNIPPGKNLKKLYPSNWDLSASRAASAAHYLSTEEGMPPEIIVAAGHSGNTPLADNSTLGGRVMNRRLVLAAAPGVRAVSITDDAGAD